MNLTDELRKSPPTRKRGQGRQAFLVRQKEIEQAISEGFSSAEVWQHLYNKGLMPIQYRQFVRYVDRYILSNTPEEKPSTEEKITSKKENEVSARKTSKPQKKPDEVSRRFEYNAKGKTKEDLI
jgi:hypothetical protein